MPYAKAKQLGIVFQGLPETLGKDIGEAPRKPHLYGSAQRQKLWLTRDTWKFDVSHSVYSQSTPPTSIVSSSSSITSLLISQNSATSFLVSSCSTIVTSPSTIITSPRTIVTLPCTIVTSPSSMVPSPGTIVTSPTSLITHSTSLPTSSTLLVAPSKSALSSPPVASTASRSLSSISSPSGTIISKDTQFGMTIPNGNDVTHAVCQLSQRQQLHGRAVTPGNVVVEVLQVLRPGLLPLCPGGFDQDEPVSVGGYYEWPCSHLVLM